jgi:hypothetical protein
MVMAWATNLFVFVGNKVDAGREVIDTKKREVSTISSAQKESSYLPGLLASKVEDSDLSIGHTTVEARLGVRLVFAITVASCWATCHFCGSSSGCCC